MITADIARQYVRKYKESFYTVDPIIEQIEAGIASAAKAGLTAYYVDFGPSVNLTEVQNHFVKAGFDVMVIDREMRIMW